MPLLVDRLAVLVVVLSELGYERHTSRHTQEVGIDIVPPLVRGAATCHNGRIDRQSRATDQGTYPADAGEELWHVVVPPTPQCFPKVFYRLHTITLLSVYSNPFIRYQYQL